MTKEVLDTPLLPFAHLATACRFVSILLNVILVPLQAYLRSTGLPRQLHWLLYRAEISIVLDFIKFVQLVQFKDFHRLTRPRHHLTRPRAT